MPRAHLKRDSVNVSGKNGDKRLMNFRLPLSFKLITLTTFLIGSVVVFVTWKNALLIESISIDKEESINLQEVASKAMSLNLLIESYLEKQSSLSEAMLKNEKSNTLLNALENEIIGIKIDDRFNPERSFEILSEANPNYKNVFPTIMNDLEKFKTQVFEGKIVILKFFLAYI